MPILAAETALYPETLLADPGEAPSDRRWWVVSTKPRQEKALARHLIRQEIPFYLPLVPRESLIRGRRYCAHVPLFGGYVFLHATEEERVASLMTNRIVRLLDVPDGHRLRNDLLNVRRLIEADAPLTVERRLRPGQWVRIKGGALAGMEGQVLKRRGRTRLLVAVKFLQQGVSIAIDGFLLEPIG